MRIVAAVATLLLLSAAVIYGSRSTASQKTSPPPQDKTPWVKLTFGLDDKAVPWDGAVSIENGRILQSAPWSFEPRDRFDPVARRSPISIAIGRRGFLEENFCGSPEAEAGAGPVVE